MSENRLSRFARWYRASALMVMNTLVLFALINVSLLAVYGLKDFLDARPPSQASNPVSDKYGERLQSVYPEMTPDELQALLSETWSRPFVYEPFTQFREAPYQGTYVNVDANGFRYSKNQGPWPPDPDNLNVFLFGGSTTFNYGVRDDQTIASYLQDLMALDLGMQVQVYNFGRGFYYSTQERILFEQLLTSGYRPDVAIFVDGLNDFIYHTGQPLFTHRMEQLLEGNLPEESLINLLKKLPLYRAANSVGSRLGKLMGERSLTNQNSAAQGGGEARFQDETLLSQVIARYTENRKLITAIADAYEVTPVFVWQPVPTYHYDLTYHPFTEGGFGDTTYTQYGYPMVAEVLQAEDWGPNFLWCADIQEGITEPLYVDQVHYSPELSRRLAQCIHEGMNANQLIQGH